MAQNDVRLTIDRIGFTSRCDQFISYISYKHNIHLAGIIYLHRISDNRMAGSPLKNLRMFGKLCGDDALTNVILATTMWDRVDRSTCVRREEELKKDFWNRMLALGSPAVRFQGTFESAWQIIDIIAKKKRVDILLLQEELVNLKRQLSETQAGMVLYNELQKLLAEHKETLRKLRDEAALSNDKQLKEELDAAYEAIQRKLESTFDQISSLKVPLGRRVALLFGKKSRIVCISPLLFLLPAVLTPPTDIKYTHRILNYLQHHVHTLSYPLYERYK